MQNGSLASERRPSGHFRSKSRIFFSFDFRSYPSRGNEQQYRHISKSVATAPPHAAHPFRMDATSQYSRQPEQKPTSRPVIHIAVSHFSILTHSGRESPHFSEVARLPPIWRKTWQKQYCWSSSSSLKRKWQNRKSNQKSKEKKKSSGSSPDEKNPG